MFRFVLFITVLTAVFSCDTKVEKELKTGDSSKSIVGDSIHTFSVMSKEIPKNVPEWYDDFPEADGYLYISANARSKSASMAEDKAIHLARVAMAQMTVEDSIGGNGEQIIQQNLQHSIVVKKSRIKVNNYWRVFVLLRMKKAD
jgi:hypothetical protein